MTGYLQRLRKTDPQVIAEAEEIVEDYVRFRYANWQITRQIDSGAKEPSITLGLIAAYLGDGRIGGKSPYGRDNRSATKWTYNVARAALGRLVRSGKLRTSLGVGLNGQESRCYEPGE